MSGRKIIFVLGIIFLPGSLLKAQGTGINFNTNLGWHDILEKAKREHKYIFVDVYATWCGPCKYMDEQVYPKALVGEYVNSMFISVKVQYDTTKADNISVKNWYADAKSIISRYKVSGLPTFLFFSPDGQIVHRASGVRDDTGFVLLASHALDSQFQYYTRVRRYSTGKLNCPEMRILATAADNNGDKDLSVKIARDYLTYYLDKQFADSLLSKDNTKFLFSFGQYILTTRDRVFTYLMDRHIAAAIDSLVKYKDFSWIMVNNVINKEYTRPFMDSLKATAGMPDWTSFKEKIERLFGKELAEHNVLEAKLDWYSKHQDWKMLSKYTVEKIDRYGLDTVGLGWYFTNNTLYDVVFEHSTDKDELKKAARWLSMMVKLWPDNENILDTYANMLYKLGDVENALYWETAAYQLSSARMAKARRGPDEEIESNLVKMKNRKPTWTEN